MIVQDYLKKHEVEFDVISHADMPNALDQAHAAGVPEEWFAKTVLLVADHGYQDVVAILPASRRLELATLSHALGGSTSRLATRADVVCHCPDCHHGVLPPFGSQYNLLTVLDRSLADQEQIAFEGNTQKEAITLRTADFIRLESPIVAPISKAPAPK